MRKIFFFTLLIFTTMPFLSQAQPRGGARAEIEQIRKNVYARVLVLTDDEAQKFWPVFDKMQQEMENTRREMNREKRSVRDNYATLSDTELDKKMQNIFNLEQKTLDIKRKYYPEFKKVLPMKKVILLPRAEREFKKELIGKIKDRRNPEDDE